jgi:hypothetical protein
MSVVSVAESELSRGAARSGPDAKINMNRSGLWIRIRIGCGFNDFVDPDLYWESGSRDKNIKKFQGRNALFSFFLNFTT